MTTRAALLEAAQSFCAAFASGAAPAELLGHFTADRDRIVVHEHGLAQLAPFLGRAYRGAEGLARYVAAVSESLGFAGMAFGDFVVDEAARKVAARGEARFTWRSTGRAWDEVFLYVLAFDEHAKVEQYEIWADSGAAYLASQGRL